jgi:site-specific DNA recombinase
MQIAIYARVSTERQERQETIASQLATLQGWVREHGHTLRPEHVSTDEGYSGARLDRPGLDALRDAAHEAQFEAVVVLSPDRLARRYAYQVLLLEELRRAGCAVIVLRRPISEAPDDQLLLQIQGAIAEYGRAVLAERFRRGKLQRARLGQYLSGNVPYGYRYVPKREGAPGSLVVHEPEAEVVRALYGWLIEERLTIRQLLKRLYERGWRPRSGKPRWAAAVVHRILTEELYAGTAYANRYRRVPLPPPRPGHRPRPRNPRTPPFSRQVRPREEWIPVPVPAIVDQATFAQAQAQLARNAATAVRHNRKHPYPLRCLLTCSRCGLGMFGRTYEATATRSQHRYYFCGGQDRLGSAREHACPRGVVNADELEAAVWGHVTRLLSDPLRLLAQFEAFAQAGRDGDAQEQARRRHLEGRLAGLAREETRLLDAYQAGVLSLDELAIRRGLLAQRRCGLLQEGQRAERLCQERLQAQEVLTSLTAFCARVQHRLRDISFAEQQVILQLVVEQIIVGEGTLEIRHVLPLGPLSTGADINSRLGRDPPSPAAQLRPARTGVPESAPADHTRAGSGGHRRLPGALHHRAP